MIRWVVAVVLFTATFANADTASDPEVTIRGGGTVGFGQVGMADGRFGAVSVSAGLEGVYWFEPGIGAGLHLSHSVFAPFSPSSAAANLVHCDEELVPELIFRGPFRRFEHGALSMQTTLGAGIADVRTMDLSEIHGHEEHATGSAKEVAKTKSLLATAAIAVAVRLSWFELSFGVRGQVNSAKDWAIGPQLTLGATF
ncbi:hypothetical protein BH11MYX1_BH11MYX1_07690 [soil metagenome]